MDRAARPLPIDPVHVRLMISALESDDPRCRGFADAQALRVQRLVRAAVGRSPWPVVVAKTSFRSRCAGVGPVGVRWMADQFRFP